MDRKMTAMARDHLRLHGLGEDVCDLVEMDATPPLDGGDVPRATITIGYAVGDRRVETAATSLPDLEEAVSTLRDREKIAEILSLGMRAMPSSVRPATPAWIAHSDGANRTRRALDRARGLADAAAKGHTTDSGVGNPEDPF